LVRHLQLRRKEQIMKRPDKGRAAQVVVGLVAVGATALVPAGAAQAAEVRPGAETAQWDILLNGVETSRAAHDPWGASGVCNGVAATTAGLAWSAGGGPASAYAAVTGAGSVAAAASTGVVALGVGLVGYLGCAGFVSACAAQAAATGTWAGMTVSPTGAWCWQY
jgi:hypothetical protein